MLLHTVLPLSVLRLAVLLILPPHTVLPLTICAVDVWDAAVCVCWLFSCGRQLGGSNVIVLNGRQQQLQVQASGPHAHLHLSQGWEMRLMPTG